MTDGPACAGITITETQGCGRATYYTVHAHDRKTPDVVCPCMRSLAEIVDELDPAQVIVYAQANNIAQAEPWACLAKLGRELRLFNEPFEKGNPRA